MTSQVKLRRDGALLALCFFLGNLGYCALFINGNEQGRILGVKRVGDNDLKHRYVFVFKHDGSIEVHYCDPGKEDELVVMLQTEIFSGFEVKSFYHNDPEYYLEYTGGEVC